MPEPSQIRWAQFRVAVMAAAAIIILSVLIYLRSGTTSLFRQTVLLRSYMADTEGVTRGALVRLNGIVIGNLKSYRLNETRDPSRVIEMELAIRKEFVSQIPDDSVVQITAENILGDK